MRSHGWPIDTGTLDVAVKATGADDVTLNVWVGGGERPA
jgi:hypothetical protein